MQHQVLSESIPELHKDIFAEILHHLPTKSLVRSRQVRREFNTLAARELFDRQDSEARHYQNQFLQQWQYRHKTVISTTLLLTALQGPYFGLEYLMNGLQTIAGWERIHFDIDEEMVLRKINELSTLQRWHTIPAIIKTLSIFYPHVKSSKVRKQILHVFLIGATLWRDHTMESRAQALGKIYPFLTSSKTRQRVLDAVIKMSESYYFFKDSKKYLPILGRMFIDSKSHSKRDQIWHALLGWMYDNYDTKLVTFILGNLYQHFSAPEERKQRLDAFIDMAKGNIQLDTAFFRRNTYNHFIATANSNAWCSISRLINEENTDLRKILLHTYNQIDPYFHHKAKGERDEKIDEAIGRIKQGIQINALGILRNIYIHSTSSDERTIILNVILALMEKAAFWVRKEALQIVGEIFPYIESADERKQTWGAFTTAISKLGDSKCEACIWASVFQAVGDMFSCLSDERTQAFGIVLGRKKYAETMQIELFFYALEKMFPHLALTDERKQLLDVLIIMTGGFWRWHAEKAFYTLGRLFPSLVSTEKFDERAHVWEIVKEIFNERNERNIFMSHYVPILANVFPNLILPDERKLVSGALLHDLGAVELSYSYVLPYPYILIKTVVKIFPYLNHPERGQALAAIPDFIRRNQLELEKQEIGPVLKELFAHLTSPEERKLLFDVVLEMRSGNWPFHASYALQDCLLYEGIEISSPQLLDLYLHNQRLSADDTGGILSRLVIAGKCTTADLEALNITQYPYGELVLQQAKWMAQIKQKMPGKFAASSLLLFSQPSEKSASGALEMAAQKIEL